jgi:hypothetical protein
MAKQYGRNEAVDFAAANLVSFGGSFTRLAGQPIDKSSLWYPQDGVSGYDRAAAYAASSAAYVGQELAVISFIYAEDGETVTGTKVTFYGIQDAEGTLKELGAVPVGDDTTIEVDTEGKISLKGISGLAFERDVIGEDGEPTGAKEEIKYQALLTKDGLTWVEPSKTTVEGLASLISALESKTAQIESAVSANTSAIGAEVTAREEAIEGVNEAISTAVETLEGAIADEAAARAAAIGKATEGEVAATGVYAAIEAALAEAKQYADDNDADTAYNDTEVKADIADHESRIGAIESTLGDEASGLIKSVADNATAIADEAKARAAADTQVLVDAKAYTDEEIVGLEISIEKKTVNESESDYIVIKNKAGAEVASVNAAKFVKDGMLDKAEYDKNAKKLTLTWNTDAGKNATEIELNDLIDTYTGSEHIVVGTDGVISIGEHVALDSDLESLATTTSEALAAAVEALEGADATINGRIDSVAADVAKKADADAMETALADKVDVETFEGTVEEIYDELDATVEDLEGQIAAKLSVADFDNAKGDFALAADVNSQFTALGGRVDAADEAIEANTEALNTFKTEVATDYATKTEVAGVDAKADSNTNLITNLTGRLDGIVAQGGEPNTINTIKVNGVAQAITEKTVDIAVPVIADTKISQLNDGQALLDRTTAAEGKITALETGVANNQTAISTLSGQVSALNTEVTVNVDARLDALEGAVNGVEGTSAGLVGTTATLVSDVAGLKTEDGRLASLIQANTDKFANYQTKADAEAQHKELSDAIANVDLTSRVAVSDFEAYKTSQKELTDTLAVAADVEATFETVNAEIAKKADATALANYYTKDEADAAFMTEAEVKATVDAVIADAVDTDTLEGLANLVEYVHENAGELAALVKTVEANAAAIETNASAIAANKAAHEQNAADIEALATTVAAQKIIDSTEITTSAVEGGVQLSIAEVNVNKLVQTAGDVLILNGGSANA